MPEVGDRYSREPQRLLEPLLWEEHPFSWLTLMEGCQLASGKIYPLSHSSSAELSSSAGNTQAQEQSLVKWIQQTWASSQLQEPLAWPGMAQNMAQLGLTGFSSELHAHSLCQAVPFLGALPAELVKAHHKL